SSAPKSFVLGGVTVKFHRAIQLPRLLPVTMRFGRQLSISMLRAIRQEEVDIIHFHGACSLHIMYGAVALRARRRGIVLVSQDHGPRQGRWLERKLWLIGLQNTRSVFAANSESTGNLESAGVPRKSISILPNGYNPDIFYPSPPGFRRRDGRLKVL